MGDMNRRKFIKCAALGTLGASTLGAMSSLGLTALAEEKGIYTPGTYSATANGVSKVTVTMTFDANAITAVTVDTAGETVGIGAHLGEQFAEQILKAQGVEVDAVSGATVTSGAVKAAAQACIDQAKGDAVAVAPIVEEELDEKAAYEAAAAPIAPVEAPEKWDYEADVIVVGSGAGGLNAALRLRENGLSCIVLEKQGITGGASRCAGFFINVGGHRQANEAQWAWPEFPYNVDKVVERLNAEFNQLTTDPELLRAMAEEGPKCIDWMVDEVGIDLVPYGGGAIPAGNYALYERSSITATNSININNGVFDNLTQKVLDAGAQIHTATAAKALVVDNGTVVGVKCEKDGAEVYYHGAKAVFLMAGGFEMNRAMLKKYLPFITDGIANCACPAYNYGDVIRMGQGCGADMSGVGSAHSYDGGVWWREYGEYEADMDSHINKDGNQAVRQPWLRINQMGQRVPYASFWGDMYPYRTAGSMNGTGLTDGAVIDGMQPGGGTFVCFDSKYEELVTSNYFGEAICRQAKIVAEDDPLISRVPEFQRDWRTGFDMMVEAGAVKKCDTIEELEEALGLRKGLLTDHVAKWNEACEKGEDYVANYKYDPKWLIPINEPPYYGAKIGAHIFTTKCGLRINSQMQVVDKQGAVIPGLYAGWHTAGGANGEFNIGGRPWAGIYGDLGQSYVGGFMAANALVKNLKK